MDLDAETHAARAFERIYRLDPIDRDAALVHESSQVRSRVRALLEAHARNTQDRFLEPLPTPVTRELQRWLSDDSAEPERRDAVMPSTIGTYRIVRTIAEGDLCSIYLAQQEPPIDRVAAVKLLHSAARRRETLRRFDIERRAIAAMRHPNIAQFYEAGICGSGQAYFAMEYIEGLPITRYCTDRRLAIRDRIELFLQVCAAIAHAHQRGIIHRDLKPSNILVADGDHPQAKVIDFGVSKAIEPGSEPAATMTGQVVGTLDYMSPEQLRGDHDEIETRADVFSLGLLLFEILSDRRAFGGDRTETRHAPLRRADDLPTRLRAVRPEFRGDLDTIVAKATAMDPTQRYPSVSELSADLERFLSGRPVLARNPGVVHTIAKFVQRNWIATSMTALVLGAGTFAGVAVLQARAERSDLAIKFAQAWLEDVLATQRTIGESPAREPKATRLVQEVREFDAQLPGEPRVRSMLASAVTELGYVNLAKGRLDAATRNFDESLAIRRELAAVGFGALGGLGDLSLSIIRCGDVAGARGDSQLQSGLYRDAFAIDERAAAAYPNDRMALSNLGWSYERLAVQLRSDDIARLDLFGHQLEVFSRLNAAGPTSDSEHGLSSGFANLALTKKYLGVPFGAEAQQALEHGRAAVALVPDDRHMVRAEIKAEFVLAESLPDPRERSTRFLEAVRRTEALCDQDPQDKVSDDLLFAASIECDQLLTGGGQDQSTLAEIRAAKQRIETRLAGSSFHR